MLDLTHAVLSATAAQDDEASTDRSRTVAKRRRSRPAIL